MSAPPAPPAMNSALPPGAPIAPAAPQPPVFRPPSAAATTSPQQQITPPPVPAAAIPQQPTPAPTIVSPSAPVAVEKPPQQQPPAAAPKPQQPDRRQLITNEIVSTEESYLRSLEAMYKVWVQPLMESAQKDPDHAILSVEHIGRLFCNIQVFYEFHKTFLTDMKLCNTNTNPTSPDQSSSGGLGASLAASISSPDFNTMFNTGAGRDRKRSSARGVIMQDCWGALFLTFSPFLKMYTMYLNNHASAVTLIEQLLKKNKKFAEFYQQANADPRCFGSNLQSLLITPVQRVPRYKLLLAELLKNTPKTHQDYTDLQAAHDQIDVVAHAINTKMKEQEHSNEILSLQGQFTHPIALVAPGRTLVHSGRAVKRGERMDSSYFFVLFNDLFIYCSGSQGKYKCHREIPITPQFTVSDNTQQRSAKNTTLEYALMIHNESKSFQMVFETKQELITWQEKFASVLKTNADKLKSRNSYHTDKQLIKTFLPIFDLRYIRRHTRAAWNVGLLFGNMQTNILLLMFITFLYIYFAPWTLAA